MTKTERRSHHRYLAPTLSILVKSTESNVNDITPIKLSMLDFNCFGMAVHSQYNFRIGEELQLIISDQLNQSVDVACFVCNRAKTMEGYRSGLHFIAQEEGHTDTLQRLMSMEQQFDNVV